MLAEVTRNAYGSMRSPE